MRLDSDERNLPVTKTKPVDDSRHRDAYGRRLNLKVEEDHTRQRLIDNRATGRCSIPTIKEKVFRIDFQRAVRKSMKHVHAFATLEWL